jgi:integrase
MAKQHDQPYSLFKRGETYYAYISFIGSQGARIQLRCSCQTTQRAQAEKYAIEKIAQLQSQHTISTGGSINATISQTFARYYSEKSIYQTRPEQALTRLNNLNQWLGITYLHEISEPIISHLIAVHRAEFAPATINRYLALLSVVLNTARDEWHYNVPYIKLSKFKLKEPPENVKYLKDWNTAQRIIDNAPEWFKPFIYTAIYTGMRLGNLTGLKPENVDLLNRRINIQVKGGKNLSIPIIDKLYDVLKDVIKPENEYIFMHNGHKIGDISTVWQSIFYKWVVIKDKSELTPDAVIERYIYTQKDGTQTEHIYKRILKDKTLPYVNFHTLRHTAATWLAQAGVNAKVIQSILGHSSIMTTNKYMHAADADRKNALDKIF